MANEIVKDVTPEEITTIVNTFVQLTPMKRLLLKNSAETLLTADRMAATKQEKELVHQ